MNLFGVNHYYLDKAKILQVLFDNWLTGENKTRYEIEVTDLGKSLSVLKIHQLTNLSKEQIDLVCISLSNAGHITQFQEDKNEKNHLWLITNSGRQAFADNYYQNQRGLANRILLFQLGGFLISLFALVMSFVAYFSHGH